MKYYTSFIQKIDGIEKHEYEEVEINLQAFITYCFIECKILENPSLMKGN